jgi:hypothetical protein
VSGLSARSEGARLSGVRYGADELRWRRSIQYVNQMHLVMPHDDRNVDELSPDGDSLGWELIVCGVDVGRFTKVVGVPRKSRWRLGGVVDARGRCKTGILGQQKRRGEKEE